MKLPKNPFRVAGKEIKKEYMVIVRKKKNGELYIPIPDEITEVYKIEPGDVAVFEIMDDKSFMVRFVRKDMFSLVENRRLKK